jgi:hypothetical protein
LVWEKIFQDYFRKGFSFILSDFFLIWGFVSNIKKNYSSES